MLQDMKFSEIPIGAKFRFYLRGAVRTKISSTTYDVNGTMAMADALVYPEDEPRPVKPKESGEPLTFEEQAREMLSRMGIPQAWKLTSVQLTELAELIERAGPKPRRGRK